MLTQADFNPTYVKVYGPGEGRERVDVPDHWKRLESFVVITDDKFYSGRTVKGKVKLTPKLDKASVWNTWEHTETGELIDGHLPGACFRQHVPSFELVNINDIHQTKPKRKQVVNLRKARVAKSLKQDIHIAALCALDHLKTGNIDRVNDFLQSIIDVTRG